MPAGPTHDAGGQGPPPKAAEPPREPSESSENCSPQASLAGAAPGGEDVPGDEPSDAAEMEQSVAGDDEGEEQPDDPKASSSVDTALCQEEGGGKKETRAPEDENPGSGQEGDSLSVQDVPPAGSGGTPSSEETLEVECGGPGEEKASSNEAMGQLGKGLALLLAKQRRRGDGAGETLEECAEEGGGEVSGGTETAAEKPDSVDGSQDRLWDTGDDDSASLGEEKAGPSCSLGNLKHATLLDADETAGHGQLSSSESPGVEPAAVVPRVDEKKGDASPSSEMVSASPSGGSSPSRMKPREGENDDGNGARLKGPRRRAMLAPPMSPPKVVAGPENDPQLDCTLNTLEAVHGAFYSPENSHHGHPR